MIKLPDLWDFLGLSTGTDTALLTELEAAAVDWIEGQTHRYFGTTGSVTEYLFGSGTRDLYLANLPNSVTSVKEQAYEGDTQTTINSTATDGFVVRDMHLVRKGGGYWNDDYEYVVAYTRGYTLGSTGFTPADVDAPDDIRQAVKQIVGYWYGSGNREAATGPLLSETIGDYSYTKGALHRTDDGLLNAIPGLRQTINHWKVWSVP